MFLYGGYLICSMPRRCDKVYQRKQPAITIFDKKKLIVVYCMKDGACLNLNFS